MPTLEWIGKEKVINHHQEVPFRVLDKQYTFNAENSENMIIHGDNLLALKSLLPQYEGRVDCIYIDPPYNTGNEKWVYNDNVNDPRIKKWLGEVVGTEGEDLSRHDKWLCMMYPRLKLLHKLLSNHGAIFISIDDNEIYNLKLICDEIFGKNNFIGSIIVKSNPRGSMSDSELAKLHEYLVIYASDRNSISIIGQELSEEMKNEYCYEDKNGKYRLLGLRMRGGFWRRSDRPNLYFPIYVNKDNGELSLTKSNDNDVSVFPIQPTTGEEGTWRWSKEKILNNLSLLVAKPVKRNNKTFLDIFQKDYFERETERRTKTKSIWDDKRLNYQNGTTLLKDIFNDNKVFDYSKPLFLAEEVIKMISGNENAIILDSFAGSGTTAHAVLNLNKQDGGNRKFILVEMMDYAETITAERVKRVINGYGDGDKTVEGTGGDFTYYELGEPLLINNELNENVAESKIREYIYYSETKERVEVKNDEPHYLGSYADTAYYFYYEKTRTTTLNREFMHAVKTKASDYVIYADLCTLSDFELNKYHITFKKIPRDITKF